MAFTPDGRVLITHEDGVGIHLWQTETLREVGFIPAQDEGSDHWLGLAPDGRLLAVRRSDGSLNFLPIATAAGELP